MGRSSKMSDSPFPPNGIHTPQGASPQTTAHIEALADDELALVKNGKRYIFSCQPGGEADVLNQIAAMVTEEDNDLTWFDAAVLSHQIGERMGQRLDEMSTDKNRRKSA